MFSFPKRNKVRQVIWATFNPSKYGLLVRTSEILKLFLEENRIFMAHFKILKQCMICETCGYHISNSFWVQSHYVKGQTMEYAPSLTSEHLDQLTSIGCI